MNEKDEWVVIKYDIIGCKFSSSEIQNYKDVKGVEPSRAKQGLYLMNTTSLELVCL